MTNFYVLHFSFTESEKIYAGLYKENKTTHSVRITGKGKKSCYIVNSINWTKSRLRFVFSKSMLPYCTFIENFLERTLYPILYTRSCNALISLISPTK